MLSCPQDQGRDKGNLEPSLPSHLVQAGHDLAGPQDSDHFSFRQLDFSTLIVHQHCCPHWSVTFFRQKQWGPADSAGTWVSLLLALEYLTFPVLGH